MSMRPITVQAQSTQLPPLIADLPKGLGPRVFSDEWCNNSYRNSSTIESGGSEGGGSSGSSISATHIVFRDTHVVGTQASIVFNQFHLRDGKEAIHLLQLRDSGPGMGDGTDGDQTAGIFTEQPSVSRIENGQQVNHTIFRDFMYVRDVTGHFVRGGSPETVRDAGIDTVVLVFRLDPNSACLVQNYRWIGSTSTCNENNVWWEFFSVVVPTAEYQGPIQATLRNTGHPLSAYVNIDDYRPIASAFHGLISGDANFNNTLNRIHLSVKDNMYYYWSCTNCLDHCDKLSGQPPNPPCPRDCESIGGFHSFEDTEAAWALSPDNIVQWGNLSGPPVEYGGVDVYDPGKAHLPSPDNDPSEAIFDICKGFVGGTPCGCLDEEHFGRILAVAYADAYAVNPNSCYPFYADADCTNYVSQCLYFGGLGMYGPSWPVPQRWYMLEDESHSNSWTVVEDFAERFSGDQLAIGETTELNMDFKETGLQPGDVIYYDLPDEPNQNTTKFNHLMIVVDDYGQAVDHNTLPPNETYTNIYGTLVNGHARPRFHVIWDVSYAYDPNTWATIRAWGIYVPYGLPCPESHICPPPTAP